MSVNVADEVWHEENMEEAMNKVQNEADNELVDGPWAWELGTWVNSSTELNGSKNPGECVGNDGAPVSNSAEPESGEYIVLMQVNYPCN